MKLNVFRPVPLLFPFALVRHNNCNRMFKGLPVFLVKLTSLTPYYELNERMYAKDTDVTTSEK